MSCNQGPPSQLNDGKAICAAGAYPAYMSCYCPLSTNTSHTPCIDPLGICNGIQDCDNGEDEAGCGCHYNNEGTWMEWEAWGSCDCKTRVRNWDRNHETGGELIPCTGKNIEATDCPGRTLTRQKGESCNR